MYIPTPSRLRQGQHWRDDYIIYMYPALSPSPFDTVHTLLQLREMTRHQKPSWQV